MRNGTEYKEARKSGDSRSETHDCSVVAISIACRIPYDLAHEVCRINGRKNGKCFYTSNAFAHLETIGYKFETINNIKQKSGCNYTSKTIGKKLIRGYYLVFVRGHVFAVKNGEVCDWTKGHNHRVINVVKVTKTHK